MSTASSSIRYLASRQCRLRHLRSLCARNVEVLPHLLSMPENYVTIGYYFSLHTDELTQAFYISEVICDVLNLNWKSFNWSQYSEIVNLSLSSIVIKLCAKLENIHLNNNEVLWSRHVCFKNLQYVGEQIPKDGHHFPANTLMFEMFEGFYAENKGICDINSSDTSRKVGSVKRHTIWVDPAALRNSYDLCTLKRVQMVQRAIKQTKASVLKVRDVIQSKLSVSEAIVAKSAERECLINKVSSLRDELLYQTQALQKLQQKCKTQKEENENKYLELVKSGLCLKKNDDILNQRSRNLVDSKETLVKTMAQLSLRRRQLISELSSLYRIEQVGKNYTIYGVHLPNSEDFSGRDETMISVALGYVCHLVTMIAYFLHVPLRYPTVHAGSRSKIYDHFLSTIPDSDREFPLYIQGKDKLQFNYGVYILNKNISQLRFYCGLTTQDLRLTLPNLKSLLDLRFGNKPEQQLVSAVGMTENCTTPVLKQDPQLPENPSGSTDSLNLDGMQQDDTSLWKPSLDNCRCGNLSVSLDEGLNKIMEGRDNLVLSGETPVTHRHHPCDEIHHSEPSLAWDNINGSQPKICNVVATKALENVLKPLQTYGSESESEESSSQHTDKLPLFSDNQ